MPRIEWEMVLGWNMLWTTASMLALGAVVYWATVRTLRTTWHRANAEQMAACVRAWAQYEQLCTRLGAVTASLEQVQQELSDLAHSAPPDGRGSRTGAGRGF